MLETVEGIESGKLQNDLRVIGSVFVLRVGFFVRKDSGMGEVETHDQPVALTGLSTIIEQTEKAVLFKKAGPEQAELVAKTAGNRKRVAAAFGVAEDKLYDEYWKRLANPQPVVEVPSGDAPVHQVKITGKDVDLTKLPFHPQHAFDGSCYMRLRPRNPAASGARLRSDRRRKRDLRTYAPQQANRKAIR